MFSHTRRVYKHTPLIRFLGPRKQVSKPPKSVIVTSVFELPKKYHPTPITQQEMDAVLVQSFTADDVHRVEESSKFISFSMKPTWEQVRQEIQHFRHSLPVFPSIQTFWFHPDLSSCLYFVALDPVGECRTHAIYSVLLDESASHTSSRSATSSPMHSKRASSLVNASKMMIHMESPSFALKHGWNLALSLPWLKRHWNTGKLELSAEERMLRERRRQALGKGVSELSVVGGRIFFKYCGELWYADFPPAREAARHMAFKPFSLTDTRKKDALKEQVEPILKSRIDVKPGGRQGDVVAFIRNRDLWVVTLDGREVRLTRSFEKQGQYSSGIPEYVMQEEFHRYTGYYWSPLSLPNKHSRGYEDNTEKLVYIEVNESQVDVVRLPSASMEEEQEQYYYPRAGQRNARNELRILEFVWDNNNLSNKIIKRLPDQLSLKRQFPWMEYIVRFGWLPDGQSVWAQLLDRKQQRMILVRIYLSCFIHESQNQSPRISGVDGFDVLYEETSDTWIDVNDLTHFLPTEESDEADTVRMILASSQSGYRHLYYIISSHGTWTTTPITSGEFVVLDAGLARHPHLPLVFFLAKPLDPREATLCASGYGTDHDPTKMRRLSDAGWTVENWMLRPTDGNVLVALKSSSQHGMYCEAYSIWCDGQIKDVRVGSHLVELLKLERDLGLSHPEFFTCTTPDGILLYGSYYLPENYIPSHVYPTLLFVYGGPKSQSVLNDYKPMRSARLQLAARLGFVVVQVDGRGSCDRGQAFEAYTQKRLGQVELADQIIALEWLAKEHAIVDLARIAVTGWSYGGYLSLLALAKYPTVFKMAFAAAPVTRWDLYDTAYTERYLGLPEENREGYRNGSVLSYIRQFPDDMNRLIIAHGSLDENVHTSHTHELVHHLILHNKPHQLQIYPTERHGLRSSDANDHFDTLLFWWLLNHL